LIGLLLALVCFVVGRWVYDRWANPLPDLPEISFAGVDPEVVEKIIEARAEVRKSTHSLKAWVSLAMLLDAHEYIDEAGVCYRAAEVLERNNPYWPYLQGRLYQSGPHPEKSLPCYERAAALAAGDMPMPRLRLADLLLALGRVDDADKEFRQVLGGNANNPYAQFGLAQVGMARQRYAEALPFLQAVAEEPHVRKRASSMTAAVYERLGDRTNADKERRRFAALSQDEPWSDLFDFIQQLQVGLRGRLLRANALVAKNQTEEAAQLIKETAAKYPESDLAWIALGVVCEKAGNFAAAEQAMAKGIALAPNHAEHRFFLGKLLQNQKRFKEAAATYRQAAELRPFHANTYFKLGECLQSLGDLAGAEVAFGKAVQYNPDWNEARQKLASLTKTKS